MSTPSVHAVAPSTHTLNRPAGPEALLSSIRKILYTALALLHEMGEQRQEKTHRLEKRFNKSSENLASIYRKTGNVGIGTSLSQLGCIALACYKFPGNEGALKISQMVPEMIGGKVNQNLTASREEKDAQKSLTLTQLQAQQGATPQQENSQRVSALLDELNRLLPSAIAR